PSPSWFCTLSLHDALPIYVDAGVVSLEELADRAGDRPDKAARGVLDAGQARAGGRVGAQVDALPARDAAPIELELRLVQPSPARSEEHTSELQSRENLVCR